MRFGSRAERIGGWGVADQTILAASGFLISVAVARTGGPSELGNFVLFQSSALFLMGMVKAAVGDPLVAESKGSVTPRLGAVGPVIVGHVVAAAVAMALAYGISSVATQTRGENTIAVLVGLIPIAALHEFSRSVRLSAMGERSLFMGDVLVVAARLAVLLTLVGGVEGSMLGMTAMASGSIASLWTIRPFLIKRTWDVSQVIRLWELGRWFVGEGFIFVLGAYGFWFIAAPRAGVAVAGQLRGVQQLFAPLQAVMVGISTIMLARLAKTGGRLTGDARALGFLQVGGNAAWAVLVLLVGSTGLTLVFGDGFEVPRSTLALFGLSVTLGAAYGVTALRLRAARLGRALLRARLAATSISLVGVALLGFSLESIVMVMVAAQFAGLIVSWAALRNVAPDVVASVPDRPSGSE